MNNTQRTIDECRIQKVGDNMTTTKTSKIGLNKFDDKRFYVNNIKVILMMRIYIYSRDLVNKICERTSSMASQASLNLNKEQLVNNILELTINDDRRLIEAAIRLYNDLQSSFTIFKAGSP